MTNVAWEVSVAVQGHTSGVTSSLACACFNPRWIHPTYLHSCIIQALLHFFLPSLSSFSWHVSSQYDPRALTQHTILGPIFPGTLGVDWLGFLRHLGPPMRMRLVQWQRAQPLGDEDMWILAEVLLRTSWAPWAGHTLSLERAFSLIYHNASPVILPVIADFKVSVAGPAAESRPALGDHQLWTRRETFSTHLLRTLSIIVAPFSVTKRERPRPSAQWEHLETMEEAFSSSPVSWPTKKEGNC